MKSFKAIAALSENRAIGLRNRIPWHLPDDFKWFKTMTTGHVIVMGRKTFESIGRPLPNRHTIVVTRSQVNIPGVETAPSLDAIEGRKDDRNFFICGGAQLYATALPRCSDLYLTRVKRIVEGDTFFPDFEHLFALREQIAVYPEFTIERWIRTR